MINTGDDDQCQTKIDHCPSCGSVDLREQEKTPHVGLYCNVCNSWVKWIPGWKPWLTGRNSSVKVWSITIAMARCVAYCYGMFGARWTQRAS